MEDRQSGVNPAKLFVGNLAYSVNDEQLTELFGQYGKLVEAAVLLERQYRGDRPPRSRGMGFVTYEDAASAQAAVEALHDKEFEGRRLVVQVARPRSNDSDRSRVSGSW